MKVHYENKLMSSFLQFVDNQILERGDAYTNHGSKFYPVDSLYSGYYTYAAPYKQFVADASVDGATVMNQVYVDGSPVSVGANNFSGINHYEGQVYFSSDQSSKTISGNYSIKDFNVYLTNDPEEKILFEDKHHIKPMVSNSLSGLNPEVKTYPAIYLKNNGGDTIRLAFGGIDNSRTHIRAIVLADSSFKLDAVCGILKDTHKKQVQILDNLPFNAMNAYTGVNYNYTGLKASNTGTNPSPIIWDVNVSKNVTRGEGLNPGVFTAFVDFQLEYIRKISG